LLEGRCSTVEEVVRYLSMLGLGNTAVKQHIEALVKRGFVKISKVRDIELCAKEDLRTVLIVAGGD
jgi:hypothetical protein